MQKKDIEISHSNILIMGFSFKENCPDHRNTRVVDIYEKLVSYKSNVDIFDPWVDIDEVERDYGLVLFNELPKRKYDSIIIAVAHNEFIDMHIDQYFKLLNKNHVIFDIKSILDKKYTDSRL